MLLERGASVDEKDSVCKRTHTFVIVGVIVSNI